MTVSACPACAVVPLATMTAGDVVPRIGLSLPDIHCSGCIAGVEATLAKIPGVKGSRVNLRQKRVAIDAAPHINPDVLIEKLQSAGFTALELNPEILAATQVDPEGRELLMRLAVAGFAMMNVMLISVAIWSGAGDATRGMFHWISAAIALPTIAFSGQPFFKNAAQALKGRRLAMDVPISLAILMAAAMSLFETFQGGEHAYFDAALSLTFFLLIGRYLDHRTRRAARSAASELSALEVARVMRIDGATTNTVPLSELKVGDYISVPVGMRIPIDGTLISDMADIDRSFLTGESLPVQITKNTAVAAGEINLTGPVIIRATAVGEDTTLRRMAMLIDMAEGARNHYTALADRAARIYAPLVHILAAVGFAGWFITTGDVRLSLNIAIAVLIITCPCALGLAVPAVNIAATGRLFRQHVLIKHASAMERLAEVEHVVFDKTGTLTDGHFDMDTGCLSEEEVSVLATLAKVSAHPVSRAISAALSDHLLAELTDIKELPGLGVQARWGNQIVRLGRGSWLGGGDGTALRIGNGAPQQIAIQERLRGGAIGMVQELTAQGLTHEILSGDTHAAVRDVAHVLGIEEYNAALKPEDKMKKLQDLAGNGKKVLMIGDGLNDSAALAGAYVSISPATALDASRAVSDVVILSPDLGGLLDIIKTAKAARRRILENFTVAALYNMLAIPLALAGFVTPLFAALAMSLSSIVVILNALRLR